MKEDKKEEYRDILHKRWENEGRVTGLNGKEGPIRGTSPAGNDENIIVELEPRLKKLEKLFQKEIRKRDRLIVELRSEIARKEKELKDSWDNLKQFAPNVGDLSEKHEPLISRVTFWKNKGLPGYLFLLFLLLFLLTVTFSAGFIASRVTNKPNTKQMMERRIDQPQGADEIAENGMMLEVQGSRLKAQVPELVKNEGKFEDLAGTVVDSVGLSNKALKTGVDNALILIDFAGMWGVDLKEDEVGILPGVEKAVALLNVIGLRRFPVNVKDGHDLLVVNIPALGVRNSYVGDIIILIKGYSRGEFLVKESRKGEFTIPLNSLNEGFADQILLFWRGDGEGLLGLKKGEGRVRDIRKLQDRLIGLGYLKNPNTGIFGPLTEEALIHFQEASGIPPTGEVDEVTLIRLTQSSSSSPVPSLR